VFFAKYDVAGLTAGAVKRSGGARVEAIELVAGAAVVFLRGHADQLAI
jgi:hypothetical protein